MKDPTGRLARCAVKIKQHSFEMIHKISSSNIVPDFLSRNPSCEQSGNKQEINLVSIKPIETESWYVKLRQNIISDPEAYSQFKVVSNEIYKYIPSKLPIQTNSVEWK